MEFSFYVSSSTQKSSRAPALCSVLGYNTLILVHGETRAASAQSAVAFSCPVQLYSLYGTTAFLYLVLVQGLMHAALVTSK